jgi:hypothetical protein
MLWDDMVGDPKLLDALSDYQLRVFGLACMWHAFDKLHKSFSEAIGGDKYNLVRQAVMESRLALTEGACSEPKTRDTVDALYGILPDEDDPDGMVPGWFETIWALACLWESMLSNNVREKIRGAANLSLEAASREDMARITMEHIGLIGDEIIEAKKSSSEYQAECEYQRGVLRAVVNDAAALLANLANSSSKTHKGTS